MRKIIINKLPFVAGLLFLISAANVQAKILPYLSLYDEPKYTASFKNFDC